MEENRSDEQTETTDIVPTPPVEPVSEAPVVTEPVVDVVAEEPPKVAEAIVAPEHQVPQQSDVIVAPPAEVAVAPAAEVAVQQTAPPTSSETTPATTAGVSLRTKTSNDRNLPAVNNQSVDIGEGIHRRTGNTDALIIRRFEDIQTAYHSFKFCYFCVLY